MGSETDQLLVSIDKTSWILLCNIISVPILFPPFNYVKHENIREQKWQWEKVDL